MDTPCISQRGPPLYISSDTFKERRKETSWFVFDFANSAWHSRVTEAPTKFGSGPVRENTSMLITSRGDVDDPEFQYIIIRKGIAPTC